MSTLKRAQSSPNDTRKKLVKLDQPATKVFPLFAPKATFQWLADDGAIGRAKTCLVGRYAAPDLTRSKVAAFDLDGTLIKQKTGNARPGVPEDWMFWHPSIPKKLEELHASGYQIVIFSNQNYAQDSLPAKHYKAKLKLIGPAINVPFSLFAGYERDAHRKPLPGMWQLLGQMSGQTKIDHTKSFYIGDAAGRVGDHSDTDRKFALNIGLPFSTPEEYFDNQKPKPYSLRGLDIQSILSDTTRTLIMPSNTPLIAPLPRKGSPPLKPEIVLFVGFPGSGKTAFFKRYFEKRNYVHVNQDTLGSVSKCVDLVSQCIAEEKNCVVDNTNRDAVTRSKYLNLAKNSNTACRIFVWEMNGKLAWHNNLYRAFAKPLKENETPSKFIPIRAYSDFLRDYQRPKLSEGFTEIRDIKMIFESEDEGEKKAYGMWLCLGGKAHQHWENQWYAVLLLCVYIMINSFEADASVLSIPYMA